MKIGIEMSESSERVFAAVFGVVAIIAIAVHMQANPRYQFNQVVDAQATEIVASVFGDTK